MIIEWFVEFTLGIVDFFMDFLPVVEFEIPALTSVFGLMMSFNAVLPVTETFQVAALILAVVGVMWTWRVLRTLFTHVPLVGGK